MDEEKARQAELHQETFRSLCHTFQEILTLKQILSMAKGCGDVP